MYALMFVQVKVVDMDRRRQGFSSPLAAQGVLCRGAPSAGVSVGCLPQRPWGLYLMESALSPRTVPERVSFEQASNAGAQNFTPFLKLLRL